MTTEEFDDENASDYGSPVSVKQEEFSFPLSPSSNVSDPSTPLTTFPYSITPHLVSPSQLILSDIVVKRPCPSSPASSMSSSVEPAPKKTKRKARTDEEKEARANERIMRNRRAAQESRDRKKRQFEALEEENQHLQEERDQLKKRIETLELRLQQFESQPFSSLLPIYDDDTTNNIIDSPPSPFSETASPDDSAVIKSEVFSPPSFAATFHPAVVNDQQCPLSKSWRTSNFLMNSC